MENAEDRYLSTHAHTCGLQPMVGSKKKRGRELFLFSSLSSLSPFYFPTRFSSILPFCCCRLDWVGRGAPCSFPLLCTAIFISLSTSSTVLFCRFLFLPFFPNRQNTAPTLYGVYPDLFDLSKKQNIQIEKRTRLLLLIFLSAGMKLVHPLSRKPSFIRFLFRGKKSGKLIHRIEPKVKESVECFYYYFEREIQETLVDR